MVSLCDVRKLISMYFTQGLPQGSSLKKKSLSGGSVLRGKSVKEELVLK